MKGKQVLRLTHGRSQEPDTDGKDVGVGTPGQNAPGSSVRTRGTTLADWEDESRQLLPDQLDLK